MQLWSLNFLSFSIVSPTYPWKVYFFHIFQLLWENWLQMTKNTCIKNVCFFPFFLEKDLKCFFKIEWRFFWGFFWGMTHFRSWKNTNSRKSSCIHPDFHLIPLVISKTKVLSYRKFGISKWSSEYMLQNLKTKIEGG